MDTTRARVPNQPGLSNFPKASRVRVGHFWPRAACALFAVLVSTSLPAFAAEDERLVRGNAILQEYCARCHAIGVTDLSPNEEAPPFRVLSESYPVDELAESLAEGIMSGHPDMPVFVFEPPDIDAIIVYLESIQVRPDATPAAPNSSNAGGAEG